MIKKISITDNAFFNNFEDDFTNDDFVLIVGKNGTGKSSLGHFLAFSNQKNPHMEILTSVKKQFLVTSEVKQKMIESAYYNYPDTKTAILEKETKINNFFKKFEDQLIVSEQNRLIDINTNSYALDNHFLADIGEVIDEKFYTSEKLLFDDFFIKQNNNKKTLFIREKVKRINTGQTIEDIGVTSQEYKTTNIMKTLEDLNKLYQSLKIILTKIDFNSALESVERLKDEIEVSVNSKLEEGGYEPVVIYKHLAREYSSGEKFVLNLIATLLIKKPLVVFLDEAEHSLHPTVQLEFLNFLKLLKITFNLDTQFFISSHSPYIIQSAVNSEIKTISLEESGNKKISVETLNWNGAEPKVSFSKLNYKIFDIPSNEYHSELFERIREISGSKSIDGTNNYLKDHFKLKMVDNTKETLPVYVRNYIHHPDERSRSLDVEKLRNSICLLEKILV